MAPEPAAPAREGRRARNKRDKRARIVEAATQLFREQGFEATTARQVCERAGIATGTLFLYVDDKRELLAWLFAPLAARTFARLPDRLRDGEDVVDGLMGLFGALYRVYGRDPRLSRIFVQELLFRGDPSDEMRALSAELHRRVARLVADARARGQLRRDVDPAALGQAFAAHYVFWLQLWLGTGAVGRAAALRGLRRALELQRDGLAPPGPADPRRST